MEPFLKRVAAEIYREHGDSLSQFCVVVPNKRSGIFFQYYLAKEAGRPLFSPKIVPVAEIFSFLSGKQSTDKLYLLFHLYSCYSEITLQPDSFDNFLYWGEIILSDFNEIDRNLADPAKIYETIADVKEIDFRFKDFLTENQKSAIRQFWGSFASFSGTDEGSDHHIKDSFREFWNRLYLLYEQFNEQLRASGRRNEGMIVREVTSNLEAIVGSHPYTKYLFLSLNALSLSEMKLMDWLKEQDLAAFYWDYESDLVCREENKSSLLLSNRRRYPSSLQPEKREEPPRFHLYSTASAVGQTKQLTAILQEIHDHHNGAEELSTAIVLPDEKLLFPLLQSIPECYDRINVTMGYPLKNSMTAGLVTLLGELHTSMRNIEGKPFFYHKQVAALLNHALIHRLDAAFASGLLRKIISTNSIYVSPEEFLASPTLSRVFCANLTGDDVVGYLQEIIELTEESFGESDQASDNNDGSAVAGEREFMYNYYLSLSKLKDISAGFGLSLKIETWFALITKMVSSVSIPFEGEPLSGLQIMGVLETRALDFKNLIILSMNEGMFPSKRGTDTFIPYSIREAFGLPTFKLNDSIYAYHFYRLFHRAENCFFFYDSRNDALGGGEVSRFIHQLQYLYGAEITKTNYTFHVVPEASDDFSQPKDERIMELLDGFLHNKGGLNCFSASSLNRYIDCPMRFYYTYVEKIEEEKDVSEQIENNLFGTIFHRVMELLYEGCEGMTITADLFERLADPLRVDTLIRRAFAEEFFKETHALPSLKGYNHLVAEVIKKYLLQLLEIDKRTLPFTYLGSEEEVIEPFPLGDDKGGVVRLKAYIDRVDRVNGSTRILDYKTGKAEMGKFTIDELFDPEKKKRSRHAFQLLLYCLLYDMKHGEANPHPAIVALKNIFVDKKFEDLDLSGACAGGGGFASVKDQFSDTLKEMVKEILNPEVPFYRTKTVENCKFCPFTTLCRR